MRRQFVSQVLLALVIAGRRIATSALKAPVTSYTFGKVGLRMAKTYSSAVSLVPPESVWEPIQRARYEVQDKGLFRWPPHVNLLYPFVEIKHFDEAVKTLSPALATISPFTLRLSEFGIFTRRNSATLWLRPDPVEATKALLDLQDALRQALPQCNNQNLYGIFVPHMTVSHLDSGENARAAQANLEAWWEPIEWRVDSIDVIARMGYEGQFRRRYKLPLGGEAAQIEADPSGYLYQGMPDMPMPYMTPLAEENFPKRRRKGGKRAKRKRTSSWPATEDA